MAKDFIGYQQLTDAALRGVVREALRRIGKQGLIGTHHFYLTFKTQFEGVDIPDFLREQYPDEMTIVLQHQFWGLQIDNEHFEVTLTFRKLPATLSIPFAALTAFFDPGVQFGLQFRGGEEGALPRQMTSLTGNMDVAKHPSVAASSAPRETPPAETKKPEPAPPREGGVVSLDAFRKK